jgi:hypothetical protein
VIRWRAGSHSGGPWHRTPQICARERARRTSTAAAVVRRRLSPVHRGFFLSVPPVAVQVERSSGDSAISGRSTPREVATNHSTILPVS